MDASDALLTAVLPLRIEAQRNTSDLDRVERLLLPSFDRFWRRPDQLQFLVIVPPGDLDPVSSRVASNNRFSIRVVSEDAVCPALAGTFGWHKQQILKLAAARIVPTQWYLTLDADVMLRRAASGDDLIRDGRAVFHPKRAGRHWEWWMASRSILQSTVHFDPDSVMMDVTPEILHRATALELLTAIGKRNGAVTPERFLFDARDAGWTEYSLYWLFVLEQRLQDDLYRSAGPLYQMAWRPEHVALLVRGGTDDLSDDASQAPFFVLQSTLEISPDEFERIAHRPPADAVAGLSPRAVLARLARFLPTSWRRYR